MPYPSKGIPNPHSNTTTAPTWSGYEYPDGSYSLGQVPPERKRKAEKDYDNDLRGLYEVVDWSEPDPTEYLGYKEHREWRLKEEAAAAYEQSLSSKLDSPQELSQDSNGKKKRYGQNGITREGKRKVRSACTLLERQYGKDRLTFGTITLPSEAGGLHLGRLYYICENWSEFCKRVNEEIKRELERWQAPTELIAVTEFQEKRYEKYGEPAPHLHFVCVGKPKSYGDKSDYYLHPDRLREIVKRRLEVMLADELGEGEEINCKNTVNLQRVRKSAANYLSKYMSKGGEILEKLKEDGLENCIPNQWWSPVGGMRKWLKKNIRKIDNTVARFLLKSEGRDGVKCFKQILIEMSDGEEKVIGIYVKVEQWLYEFLSGIKWDSPIEYKNL